MNTAFRLLPDRASNHAAGVDHVLAYLLGVTGTVTLAVAIIVVVFAIKYRTRKPGQEARSVSDQHSRTGIVAELAWTIIPLLIFLTFFVAGARLYVRMETAPADCLEINVVAKQWMWKLQHPTGAREINELHVPVGRAVRLNMISQDVVHSFGIPAFSTKQDVLPGRYTSEWFIPTKPGEYHFFCDQYCGAEHSKMIGTVFAMEPAKYQEWLEGRPKDVPPVVAGEQLFAANGCIVCHSTRGPTMAGLFGRHVQLENGGVVVADEDYLRESILNPSAKIVAGYPPIMPSFKGQLSEEQLMDLVAYIKSLAGSTSDAIDPAVAPQVGGSGSPTTQPLRAVPGPGPFLPQENVSKP